MERVAAVQVGVRELKNRLTSYLKLAQSDHEVIVTAWGKPIALIQPLVRAAAPRSLEARIAALAARGEITAPERRLKPRVRRLRITGRLLSGDITADRR